MLRYQQYFRVMFFFSTFNFINLKRIIYYLIVPLSSIETLEVNQESEGLSGPILETDLKLDMNC